MLTFQIMEMNLQPRSYIYVLLQNAVESLSISQASNQSEKMQRNCSTRATSNKAQAVAAASHIEMALYTCGPFSIYNTVPTDAEDVVDQSAIE